MKVTFVLPFAGLQGGIRVLATYAERLKQRGHTVFVVSTPPDIPLRRKVKSLALGRGWPAEEKSPSHFDGTTVEHRVLERVRPLVDADLPDADVLVATYYTTVYAAQGLAKTKGAPVLFIQGYEVDDGVPNPKLDATWRMPMHKIAISRWLVDLARAKFGDTVVSYVRNSVDTIQFNAPPRGKRAVPTVGLLHSNAPTKGCAASIRVINQIATVLPSLRVVSHGADEPRGQCRMPDYVDFVRRPPQNGLRDIYEQCDVWLSSSHSEGFSLPLLEAMACRCPVVSTRCGGPLDIVDDNVNGFLADVNDVPGLTDGVLRILRSSDEQWKRLSDAAYLTATRYTWSDATVLFEQALRHAVNRHNRGEIGRQAVARSSSS